MQIKIHAWPTGIPFARVTVDHLITEIGGKHVRVLAHALDAFGLPTVVSSLRLSVPEARALVDQINSAVNALIEDVR